MPFTTSDSQLRCDRLAARDLAEKFGTPLYCYSATDIRDRFRAFDRAFRAVPHTVCYSVKANSNLALLRMLAKLGAGFDVVSGGELERVLRAHKPSARRVVFSGVGKTAAEMDAALRAGILLFNAESEAEIELLAGRAARLRKRAPVALRVNPDVPAETHPYISTGLREHKFGVAIDDAERIYATAARHPSLHVAGVSVHIGSQITSPEPFAAAMDRVAALVRRLRASGHDIRYVDAGGGLGINYQHAGAPPVEPGDPARPSAAEQRGAPQARHSSDLRDLDFPTRAAAYAHAVVAPLRKLKLHLLLEPGRSIVGPAGALLARVLYVKQNGAKRFVVLDAAMNDLIRPSLYGAYHEILPADPPLSRSADPPLQYDVVGPICETGDFFARDRALPELAAGDLVAVLDAGAYGMSLSSNYNTRPRAAEVMVDGNKVQLIRRRETIDDLLRTEIL